ncbi:hypothetical protein BVRB_8g184140 [Beta vulgaris subsp. vulgaris]|nr:hypothetical protein BVRB_8g184140 [Beta vulgaris subsp. vulgaris]
MPQQYQAMRLQVINGSCFGFFVSKDGVGYGFNNKILQVSICFPAYVFPAYM